MRIQLFLISLLSVSSGQTIAGEADIIAAEAELIAENRYLFKVTVKHDDESWDHFAKAWEILDAEGKVIDARILRHPHIHEQPFTRNLTVTLPEGINKVTIRAYDLVHKYGGQELTLTINRDN